MAANHTVPMLNTKGQPRLLDPINVPDALKAGWKRAPGTNMFDAMQQTVGALPDYQNQALTIAQPVINQLPTAGMVAAGPPGALTGALLQQGLSPTPPHPILGGPIDPYSLQARAQQVAEQTLAAKAGELVGPGVKATGRAAEWLGAKTGAAGAVKTIWPGLEAWGKGAMRIAGQLTPESAQTAIDHGILMTKGGLEKLGAKIGDIANATKAVAASVPVTQWATQIGPEAQDEILSHLPPNIAAQPEANVAVARAMKFMDNLKTSHGGDLVSAGDLQSIKQAADQIANPIFEKLQMKQVVPPDEQLTAQLNKAVADWARDKLTGHVLEDGTRVGGIGGGVGNRLAQLNGVQSKLIQLKNEIAAPVIRAEGGGNIGRVIRKGSGYTAGVAAGSLIGGSQGHSSGQRAILGGTGALIGAAAMSPPVLSWIAQMLSNPAMAKTLATIQQAAVAGGQAPPGAPPVAQQP
jgi:hypothetical protein